MRLFLIRHGQTAWNLKNKYCSFTELSLNAEGIRQAQRLYLRLRKENFNSVYSSDYKRALHFAQIVFKGQAIIKSSELREMNFGIFEGLSHSEIMKRYGQIYKKWLDNPFKVDIPKGEPIINFEKRINRILKKIVSSCKDKTVAIVTHGGPIKLIIADILELKNFWHINVDLASVSLIEFKRNEATIVLLNDRSHLYE